MSCPACGAALPAGSRFCPSCGHALSLYVDERRVVTVLFGDLVGFTSMAESLDPEAVKALVDRGFERLVRDIVEFGGRVDKILGDAIVALFGAPIAHEDDPERAVRAALQMQKTMRAYAAEVGADIQMRIGVNTGEVLTGAMRAGGDYTAMGDVVNVANRLQTAARPGQVYVGPLTAEATRDVITYEEVGAVQARGKEEPVEAWRAVDVLVLPGRRPRLRQSPLIGRDPEFALLRSGVSLAYTQRRTQLVLLLGDAGVGKTRLADEVASWVQREKGARMLESNCVPYGEANIWYPIGAALRSFCDIADDANAVDARERCNKVVGDALESSGEAPIVARTSASLLYLMGYEGALRDFEPQRAREEAARGLIRFLEAVSIQQPVFFRLADLHWADDLVLELIDEVIDGLGRAPFVLVATARHLLDARWSPRTGRHNHLILNLDPLDAVAASQLLDQLLDDDIDPTTRRMLLARSGGNPFFLEELVALLERQELHDPGVEPSTTLGEVELPETLRGLIAARLDRLAPDERAVLDNASVLGRSGPLYALEKVCEVAGLGATWRAGLDLLVDRELLNLVGTRWSFRSDLVREVAYGTLTKNDRAHRHAEIARWMEANFAGPDVDDGVVDRIAFHYAQAAALTNELGFASGLPADLCPKALHWLGEAGRRAKQAEVHVLASRLYSQALDLGGDHPSAERLEFLLGRAEARFGLFELAGARADVAEAIVVADAIDDVAGSTRALLVEGEICQREGDLDGALAVLDRGLAQFRSLGDRRGEAEALRLIGMTRLFQRVYAEAESSTSAALDIFRELEDKRGEAWALQNLAWISYLSGRVAEAEVRIDASAATFAQLGDSSGLGWANALLAFTRFHQGRFVEAERLAEEILPDARARGDRFGEGMMLLLTALVRLWSGRTNLAIERADEARSLFSRVGDAMGHVQAQCAYGRATVASGRIDAGFRAIDAGLAETRGGQLSGGAGLAATVGLATSLHIGDVTRAAVYRPQIEGAEADNDPIAQPDRDAGVVLYLLQCGEIEAASTALAAIVAGQHDLGPGLLVAGALAAVASGDTVAALEYADRAHESPRATYLDLAFSYVSAGLAHAVRGDTSEVIVAFAAARQVVDGTGDAVARAVVLLAESFGLSGVGATSARGVRREAERRLADLGIGAEGWATLFRSALRWRGAGNLR